MRTWTLVVLALAVALGCSKDDTNARANEAAKTVPTQPQPPPQPALLEIFVNDASVAKLTAQQVAAWPRLDTLVPVSARRLGTWQTVYVKGAAAKPAEVGHPSAQYPDLVPAVFPAGGGAAFGMFDPVALAKHGAPSLQMSAREIRIVVAQGAGRGEHESGEGGGTDPMQLKITFKTPHGESTLDGAKLLAIPRETAPGDSDPRGWTLKTVLDAGGIKKFDRLLLTDASGTNLTLDKADFDPKSSVPYIKLNRQGALRFRIFKKQGDAWQPTGDLRGLVAIEVIK